MTPAYRIIVGGRDLTAKIADRLSSLTVVDQAGVENDSVTIELDDRQPHIALPAWGARIRIYMGYKGGNLRDMGLFELDEASYQLAPDRLSITGRAISTSSRFKETKSRSWDNITIGEMVTNIASEYGLTPRVAADISKIKVNHLDQTSQSDGSMLTDLVSRNNAIMKIVDGFLYVGAHNATTNLSGAVLPRISISHSEALAKSQFQLSSGRAKANAVSARAFNVRTGEETEVVAGDSAGTTMELPNSYPSAAEAEGAAQSMKNQLDREVAKGRLELRGNPSIVAETRVYLRGFRPEVSKEWVAARVQHIINDGFITRVDLENPAAAKAGSSSGVVPKFDINRVRQAREDKARSDDDEQE